MTHSHEYSLREHNEDPIPIDKAMQEFAAQQGITDEQMQAHLERGHEQELQQASDKLDEALRDSRADAGTDPKHTKEVAKKLEDSIGTVSSMLGSIIYFQRNNNNNDSEGPNSRP